MRAEKMRRPEILAWQLRRTEAMPEGTVCRKWKQEASVTFSCCHTCLLHMRNNFPAEKPICVPRCATPFQWDTPSTDKKLCIWTHSLENPNSGPPIFWVLFQIQNNKNVTHNKHEINIFADPQNTYKCNIFCYHLNFLQPIQTNQRRITVMKIP